MQKLDDAVIRFLENQGFVVVSTVDNKGSPHSSCKGIVKIEEEGRIYLLDLYLARTHSNLARDNHIAITAVDEHRFRGYCLKGKARIMPQGEFGQEMLKAWEERITSRLTVRLLKNMREEKGHLSHPEVLLPKPEYIIVMEVEEVVDLTPQQIKITAP